MREFYLQFFDLNSNEKYHNSKKNFSSYFLSFPTGARIELIYKPEISEIIKTADLNFGLTHYAISVGSKEKVDELTNLIRQNGYRVVQEPRTTGDGYYESVISDPEGNIIELTE